METRLLDIQDDQLEDIKLQASQADDHASLGIIRNLRGILTSDSSSATYKLYALELFVACMETANPVFLSKSTQELLPWLVSFAEYRKESKDPCRGLTLFDGNSKIEQQSAQDFLALLLKSIQNWASAFKNIESGYFRKTYMDLRHKGVNFNVKLSNSEQLRDIRRTVILLETPGTPIIEVKDLVKIVKSFKHKSDKDTPGMAQECLSMYENWKAKPIIKMDENLNPKPLQRIQIYNSMLPSDSEVSSENSLDPYKLLERLAEYEDNILSYKGDLMNLQEAYSQVVIKLRSEKTEKEKLRRENSELSQSVQNLIAEVNSLKEQSSSYEKLINQLNETMLKLEVELQDKENEIIKVQKKNRAKRQITLVSKLRLMNESPEKNMEELDCPIAHPYSMRRIKNFSYDDRYFNKQMHSDISNKEFFDNCLLTNAGQIYDNQNLSLNLEMKHNGSLCMLALEVFSKHDLQDLSMDFIESPSALTIVHNFETLCGRSQLLTAVAKATGLFSRYPILKVSYKVAGKDFNCLVGIPLTQCMFFDKTEINYLEAWKELSEHSVSNDAHGNFENYSISYFTTKASINCAFLTRKIVNSSAIIYSQFSNNPVLCKLSKLTFELKIEVRCRDVVLAAIVLELIRNQFKNSSD